jgi:hypothetical protein
MTDSRFSHCLVCGEYMPPHAPHMCSVSPKDYGAALKYQTACRAVRALGMDVVDGLALTFSCTDYPAWVRNMNGWAVEDVARAIRDRTPDNAAIESATVEDLEEEDLRYGKLPPL